MMFACIPARGGSSLKGKNLRELWGSPLIRWVIEAAKEVADIVCVSTDCPDIAKISLAYGATVVMRPSNISGGKSPSEDAVNHAIESLEINPDITLLVQATTPTVTTGDLKGMITLLEECDSVFLAWPTSALIWDGSSSLNHDHHFRPMRQDRMQLEEAGCYAWKGKTNYRFFGKVKPYVTNIGIDINDEQDFKFAETLAPNYT